MPMIRHSLGWLTLVALLMVPTAAVAEDSFSNPINPAADPWMGYADGAYRLATTQGTRVRLWSAPTIGGLKKAEPVTIWEKGIGVWAPEFHQLKGPKGLKWYCYFTKTDGEDQRHRMFVMESKTAKIEGPYADPVQIFTDPKDEFYAIDGSVFETKGTLYFLWAGFPGHRIFISKMNDPLTLEGGRVLIPASGFGCPEVREGPFIITHRNRIFLTYSACDTGKPDYKVGCLWMKEGDDPMQVKSWTQLPEPLLQRNDAANVYGPGHHSFFKSADGKEDWIAYHAKTTAEYTYKGRSTRVQKIEWDAEGFPKPVIPVSLDTPMKEPGR